MSMIAVAGGGRGTRPAARRCGSSRRSARTGGRGTRGRRRRRAVRRPGRLCSQIALRSASSGIVNSTRTWMPAQERLVDVLLEVGRQRRRGRRRPRAAAGGTTPRCWRSGRGRRVTSERLPNRASASSKKSTTLPALGGVEDLVEVLLRLADVLADHRRQVELEQVEAELAGDDLGGQRLAGARRPGEQRDQAARRRRREAPLVVHRVGVAVAVDDLAQQLHAVGRQHDVVPRRGSGGCGGRARRSARRRDGARRGRGRRRGCERRPTWRSCVGVRRWVRGGVAERGRPLVVGRLGGRRRGGRPTAGSGISSIGSSTRDVIAHGRWAARSIHRRPAGGSVVVELDDHAGADDASPRARAPPTRRRCPGPG